MSIDRDAPEWVDDRQTDRIPDDAPLREIAPDDFVARSSESTLREALKAAERQTSRDGDELPRCPECLSFRLRRKPGRLDMPHRIETAYKCVNGHHFDEPAPSREEAREGEQDTLPGVRER